MGLCFGSPLGEVDEFEGELDLVEHDLFRLDFCDAADEELGVFEGELEVDVVEHRDEHVPGFEVCFAEVGPEHEQRFVVDGSFFEDQFEELDALGDQLGVAFDELLEDVVWVSQPYLSRRCR